MLALLLSPLKVGIVYFLPDYYWLRQTLRLSDPAGTILTPVRISLQLLKFYSLTTLDSLMFLLLQRGGRLIRSMTSWRGRSSSWAGGSLMSLVGMERLEREEDSESEGTLQSPPQGFLFMLVQIVLLIIFHAEYGLQNAVIIGIREKLRLIKSGYYAGSEMSILMPIINMSGRLINTTARTGTSYFRRPLKEFEYKVIPPPEVPPHIVKPQYAVNKITPQFAIYEGEPRILSAQHIKKIRKSAAIASRTLKATEQFLIRKGQQDVQNNTDGTITAEDIDKFVYNFIVGEGAYPTPIGFIGFPKSVCVSINECIVHGIPSLRPIYIGDKINIDVTAYFDGFHGDTNLTVIYGGLEKAPSPQIKNIVTLTQKALYTAIGVCNPGVKFNQVGLTIQRFAHENKIHVCQHFTGHGVGHLLHMPPMVFHVYIKDQPHIMKPGNVFTIEPVMAHHQCNTGLQLWSDGLTVVSPNNPNAQFQHMILITEDGSEVLTQREGENIPNPNGNIKNLKRY